MATRKKATKSKKTTKKAKRPLKTASGKTKKVKKAAKKVVKKVEKAFRNWSRPLPLTEVKKLYKKGIKTIVSSSGFTEGSVKYAKRYKIKLYHNKKKIV